ncbi:hypothetical protein [Lactobacillus rizhaonensis]|uniref:restriction endonuclease n=1 Tax=Lactobacillus rizhaonensis TaxID=3082863 RepID=UPI0030C7313B
MRLLVSSADQWNNNAQSTLVENTTKPFITVGLSQLRNAHFDWKKFYLLKKIKSQRILEIINK